MAAVCAIRYWWSLHIIVWALFLSHETLLSRAIHEGRFLYPIVYAAVTLGSIATYRAVCWSDPGYVTQENCDDLVEAHIHTLSRA